MMNPSSRSIRLPLLAAAACACMLFVLAGCNLVSSDARVEQLPQTASNTPPVTLQPGTRTTMPMNATTVVGAPTSLPGTTNNNFLRPTAIVILPPTIAQPQAPANTLPTGIYIVSPGNGNIVAGSVQILGSASHPQFLQYVVEFGPEPNNANLWYQATGAVQSPVNNGLLGIWNTAVLPDGLYQLRLRVFLRDGTLLASTVNGIRTQNRAATPVPSNTPSVPGPIAAFSQNTTIGTVPLAVQFTNQSAGSITGYLWNFGDGTSSTVQNPSHTFTNPGLYTVSLTVTGPGGSANVSQQISARTLNAPVAAFDGAPLTGTAPLTVQFTNRSTGSIASAFWNFSDGTSSTEQNPAHTFINPGTYNVFLTVTGPGGSTFVNREVRVTGAAASATTAATFAAATATTTDAMTAVAVLPTNTTEITAPTATTEVIAPSATIEPPTATLVPPPSASFTASAQTGTVPAQINFTNASSGEGLTYAWDFNGDNQPDSFDANPTFSFTQPGVYNVTLTVTNAGGSSTSFPVQITIDAPAQPTATSTPEPTTPPPALAAAIPVQPDTANQAVSGRAGEISTAGAAQGRNGARFAIAPGWLTASRVLADFGPGAMYNLNGDAGLQSVVDRYNNGGDGTATSFTPPPFPIVGEATAARLNSADAADPAVCTPGETPFACYLRVWSPAVVFVGVGIPELTAGEDPAAFAASVTALVQTAANAGVLPVVVTLPPVAGIPADRVNAYNDALITLASNERVPVLNLWAALSPLGETSGTLQAAPGGAGDLTGGAISSYTANIANAELLDLLRRLIESGFVR